MEENDYDALRQKNISERNNIFMELFDDIKKQQSEIKIWKKQLDENIDVENQPLKKKRRRISAQDSESFNGKGIRVQFRRKYNIRNRKNASNKDGSNDSESDNEKSNSTKGKNNPAKLTVMFSWAKPIQRPIDLMNMDVLDESEEEDDYSLTKKKRNRGYHKKDSIRDLKNISVNEITKDMLDNVAKSSSQKTYSSINGTTCHQCRQKTIDTKTICRSENCVGVRGQFCGPCLQGRYGENIVEALKDSNWACPPCRDLCNCSICRIKNGRCPTGILVGVARSKGYSSVMEYLQAITDDSE